MRQNVIKKRLCIEEINACLHNKRDNPIFVNSVFISTCRKYNLNLTNIFIIANGFKPID